MTGEECCQCGKKKRSLGFLHGFARRCLNSVCRVPFECLVVEPILLGMVLGLVTITLAGLFFAAYKQYRREPM